MAKSKKPGKDASSRAAKILRDPKSSKSAKSRAGKTLSQRVTPKKRKVKSAPKSGAIKKSTIKRAVSNVKGKRTSKRVKK